MVGYVDEEGNITDKFFRIRYLPVPRLYTKSGYAWMTIRITITSSM